MLLGLLPIQVSAQSLSNNYVQTRTYREAGNASKCMEQIQYFDDLGREEQLVLKQFAPNGQDLVSGIQYDGYGRKWREFIPVQSIGSTEAMCQAFPNRRPSSPETLLLTRKLDMKPLLWNEYFLKREQVRLGTVRVRRSVATIWWMMRVWTGFYQPGTTPYLPIIV